MSVDTAGSAIALGGGAEFDAIRAMSARWGARARSLGDDAALLNVPRGEQLVVSVDSAVEGRHFRAEWFTPRQIANRAVRAALSDLAAMAARPIGILVALGVPERSRGSLDEIADGIGDALTYADTVILGGNLAAATELSITTTVLGYAYAPLRRDGAHAGDDVYVTGRLGQVRTALDALLRGEQPEGDDLRRMIEPQPRLAEARWLASHGATAAIDISDGLAADLSHLAAASGVRIAVDLSSIPCSTGVAPRVALGSGEEFELIASAPATLDRAEFERRFGLPLTKIGRVSAGDAGVDVLDDGRPIAIPPGHDHFSS